MLKITEAYSERPQVSFKDQEEGEVVLLLLRRHFVTNLPWILVSLLIFLLPIVFLLSPYKSMFPFLEVLPSRFLLFIFASWYQFLLIFILISFSSWFFSIDLVTDRRILDIDYWGFLYFNVSETPLSNIQDVTYNISGLTQTFLNYGNLYIQTAGTSANFDFIDVPSPAAVHDLVTDLMQGKNVKHA
jgi:membrane protein YdbS with pleckstrin-like domain